MISNKHPPNPCLLVFPRSLMLSPSPPPPSPLSLSICIHLHSTATHRHTFLQILQEEILMFTNAFKMCLCILLFTIIFTTHRQTVCLKCPSSLCDRHYSFLHPSMAISQVTRLSNLVFYAQSTSTAISGVIASSSSFFFFFFFWNCHDIWVYFGFVPWENSQEVSVKFRKF